MTSEKEYHHHSRAPVWGIFLIFIGVILLLQTLNVLPWGLWGTLWRFWPALIIIVGLAIILRNYNAWLISLLTIIILGGSLGIAIWQNNTGTFSGEVRTEKYSQPLGNLGQAAINIDFSAGHINTGSLSSNSPDLVQADVESRNHTSSLSADFTGQAGNGNLDLNSINQQYWPTGGIHWTLDFTRDIPLTFNIRNAASAADYNFSSLRISQVDLNLNAGSCTMNLPEPSGIVPVNITDNAASVDISIPDDAAARIHATTNVGSLNVGSRFVKQGSDYFTNNYEEAANRFEFDITTNVGSVDVR